MRYRILGVTEAQTEEGAPVPVGGPRLRALLAALALHAGRPVPVDVLIDEVWADEPPYDAPAALQALVGRLRRVLGREAVVSEPGGYRLTAAADDIDLHRFERLVREGTAALHARDAVSAARILSEALALWRGPVLADLPDRSAATRLEAQRLEATRARAQAELALGRAPGLVPELKELVTAHPYDEPLHALLIRALRDAGRRADALTAYEDARRILADGLGTDPGPELRALHAELLAPEGVAWGGVLEGNRAGSPAVGAPSGARSQEAGAPDGAGSRDAGAPSGAGGRGAGASSGAGSRVADPSGPSIAASAGRADGPVASMGAEAGPAAAPAAPGASALADPRASPSAAPGGSAPALGGSAPALGGSAPAPGGSAPAAPTALGESAGAGPGEPPGAGPAQPAHPAATPHRPERKGNLRPRLNSFVGREPELAAIRSDLQRARLVTLTGPGGSGKTRLAEEAAAGHPDAWLVELAPLDQPEAVPGAVVSALGLRETVLMTSELTAPQDDPVTLLVEYCGPRGLLLVLDNCEHVIDAAARLAETLLTRCPDLTVLATSREPLGVPGESVRPVEPLPPHPAYRLFTERATAVRPGFEAAADADTAAVAEICRRLDGLPLAIELAAARLRMLTPRQIADRLDDRFRLLTSGSRTALPRQQTLRAVVDWSWDLLDERERTVLRELSVFAGGWDLEAAEAVCTGPAADVVGALVDKSLVVAAPCARVEDGMRYRMLETIHEYASERAAEAPELRATAERRHSAYFRALVEKAEPLLRSAEQLPWIRRMETELDNIRAALHRAVATGHEEQACALALGTGWFWWLRNFRREGVEWIERILRMSAATDIRDAPSPWWAELPPSLTAEEQPRPGPVPQTGPAVEGQSGPGPVPQTGPAVEEQPGSAFDRSDDPLYWPRMSLRLLHLFLVAESRPGALLTSERVREYVTQVQHAFDKPVPAAARFPGLIWPFTPLLLGGPPDVGEPLEAAVANCRRFGGDWEVAVLLMFRTHTVVDSVGGVEGIDDDLAELRRLGRRVGDRWVRAQVSSAAGEAAMARSRFDEAKEEYEEALRLAYEVGAYAETPFLIARLAEIAYRSGDRETAGKALDEASAEADRHGVTDSRAFVRLLAAMMALDDGDVVRARMLCDAGREEAARGTPPPQFIAGIAAVDARIVAVESGPEHALPRVAEILREAVASGCAEAVTAALVDTAATFLARLGDHARATRLLAAGAHWRGGHPRPMPDRAEAEEVAADARAALGPRRYEAEYEAGAGLTADGVLAELAAALAP
ncbi:AfsR/SARP family transcriptional regulator [Streptomyces jeddahensis]|uniref:Putative HTH-type transcriptional regulatorc n=1 Tax=Streptomyces jeddahensis TaxID=1716141 RepID=A0A177HXV2_9ACTN|nr:BTAD domain-containing putative transcriptional regulator [Streptomyces jeddahensis]OAH14948.1 putative HTH-type transcriptional regulatorc [Streptomyces jeddahensis]